MAHVHFNAPPGWPVPPAGWMPPVGWEPPASWPPAPDGWDFLLELPTEPVPSRDRYQETHPAYQTARRRPLRPPSSPPGYDPDDLYQDFHDTPVSRRRVPPSLIMLGLLAFVAFLITGTLLSFLSSPGAEAVRECSTAVRSAVPVASTVPDSTAGTSLDPAARLIRTGIEYDSITGEGDIQTITGWYTRTDGTKWAFTCQANTSTSPASVQVDVQPPPSLNG